MARGEGLESVTKQILARANGRGGKHVDRVDERADGCSSGLVVVDTETPVQEVWPRSSDCDLFDQGDMDKMRLVKQLKQLVCVPP